MYDKNNPATIQLMFDRIANRYDLTNAVLSLSLHKQWNRTLVRSLSPHPRILVDLCSGTGDIACCYLSQAAAPAQVYLIDFSSEMLELAKRKATQFCSSHQLSYIQADVQQLPLSSQIADCATIAYGIRNVKDPLQCLQEAFRILKPGGCLGILELTRPKYRLLRLSHHLYLRTFIPLLGKWLTANKQAYQYLCQSIHTFIAPQDLITLLDQAGFKNISTRPLMGGIATIFLGYKCPIATLV